MPFHESDSIILKTYPLAEADRIVVFFSEKYGKVRGVANGARKLKNRFGASLEPLAQSRLRFFQKEGSDLVRIRSSELLDSPMKLFEDLGWEVADCMQESFGDNSTYGRITNQEVVLQPRLVEALLPG